MHDCWNEMNLALWAFARASTHGCIIGNDEEETNEKCLCIPIDFDIHSLCIYKPFLMILAGWLKSESELSKKIILYPWRVWRLKRKWRWSCWWLCWRWRGLMGNGNVNVGILSSCILFCALLLVPLNSIQSCFPVYVFHQSFDFVHPVCAMQSGSIC